MWLVVRTNEACRIVSEQYVRGHEGQSKKTCPVSPPKLRPTSAQHRRPWITLLLAMILDYILTLDSLGTPLMVLAKSLLCVRKA